MSLNKKVMCGKTEIYFSTEKTEKCEQKEKMEILNLKNNILEMNIPNAQV